jgi:arginyl-tRNA--protein-N-Asp/Glu arginylyltransferase
MRVLFSESGHDYSRYRYPYVVWAQPEPGETPADLYAAGFHPASPNLDRFVLCRHLRIRLPEFRPSSENRRVLRQGEGLSLELRARGDFEYTDERREAWLAFAEERFGPGIMHRERLDGLMRGRVVTHILACRDATRNGEEVAHALMYLEPPRMAHYYYAFYELRGRVRSLGLFFMTAAAELFRAQGFEHLYIGTCYSERALYKVQFSGLEYFNGVEWSRRMEVLKATVRHADPALHRLEDPEFLEVHGGLDALWERTGFRLSGAAATEARGSLPSDTKTTEGAKAAKME